MDHPSCPRCQSTSSYKNGTANGDPKRKCKDCGYQFTRPVMPGFTSEQKDRAVVLYLEGLSLRTVAKLLSTTATSVLKWVRAAGKAHGQRPEPEPGAAPVIEVDEMWHYVKKKPANCGFGRPSAGKRAASSTGNAGTGTKKR